MVGGDNVSVVPVGEIGIDGEGRQVLVAGLEKSSVQMRNSQPTGTYLFEHLVACFQVIVIGIIVGKFAYSVYSIAIG